MVDSGLVFVVEKESSILDIKRWEIVAKFVWQVLFGIFRCCWCWLHRRSVIIIIVVFINNIIYSLFVRKKITSMSNNRRSKKNIFFLARELNNVKPQELITRSSLCNIRLRIQIDVQTKQKQSVTTTKNAWKTTNLQCSVYTHGNWKADILRVSVVAVIGKTFKIIIVDSICHFITHFIAYLLTYPAEVHPSWALRKG